MSEGAILVTGVSGFLGSHVAKQLLEAGYKVRGTVRSLENKEKVEPLKSLVTDCKFELELVALDLNDDEGWEKALEGCEGVMHVASPFPDITTKAVSEEELLGPAREGTIRVLKAAAGTKGAVKRVVLTSSFAAVFGETVADPSKCYNEDDWTDVESSTIDAYTKSKAVAEKAAWDFVKDLPDESKFELSVINPTLILGPPLMASQNNATSVNIMSNIINRAYPGVPRVQFPVCDVRDVAKAHVKAMEVPEAAGKRHIILTESLWLRDIAVCVAKEFRPQGYSVATAQLPSLLCWLAGLFNRGLKQNVVPRLGKTLTANNSRMKEVLQIEPTSITTTLHDMVYAMIDLGMVKKAKKYKQAGSRAEVTAVNGEVDEEGKKEEEEEEKKKEEEEEKEEEKELEPEDKEKKEEIKEVKKEEEKKEEEEKKKKEGGGEEEKEKKKKEEEEEEGEKKKEVKEGEK